MTREEAAKIKPGDLITVRARSAPKEYCYISLGPCTNQYGDVWVSNNYTINPENIIRHEPAPPRAFQIGDIVSFGREAHARIIGINGQWAWIRFTHLPLSSEGAVWQLDALKLVEAVEGRKP